MRIQADTLTSIVTAIFEKTGSPTNEAALVSGSLVTANLMGHDSHGVGLVPTYVRHIKAGLLHPGTAAECVKDDGAIMMFDGCRGFGRRAGGEAMAAATERCRDTGVVLMTLRNAHHIGRIGAYGEIAMEHGMISLHFVNVIDHGPTVAPWGAGEARYVTNPVCIAVPGTKNTPPTLLDMATSLIALGKARVAMSKGEQMAEGLMIDAEGQPTTDPSLMYATPKGALLPFGEHKGSGLALMCELLAGGLSGGGTIQPDNPQQMSIVNNMFTIVIDPARLVDMIWLQSEIDATIDYVKSARPADPEKPVIVAGDAERARTLERLKAGIEINDEAWAEISETGEGLGMERPTFEVA